MPKVSTWNSRCYGGLGQWYLLKIQMQVKLSTQYFIAQTFPQKVRLPCMRGYVQHCLTTICLHFCSWKSRFAENALVSHSPHCQKTTGCVKRCFQYQQGVLRDNLSQLSIDDIDIPGSSKGCWMNDKGCLYRSLRVQTAPFGRYWYKIIYRISYPMDWLIQKNLTS